MTHFDREVKEGEQERLVPRRDPRNNADDAYAAFMSMSDDEWHGLHQSLMRGGVLQPKENEGFMRALKERGYSPKASVVPDYSGEPSAPSDSTMQRLNTLVLAMAELELEETRLEEELKETTRKLREYKEKLVPELMTEAGVTKLVTKSGVEVELKEEVRAAFPKTDQEKRQRAFAYLEATGDDGIIKREFSILYGRDSVAWAEEFSKKLEELGVAQHATVEEEWSVNHQTLLAYLRRQLKDGANVPMEAFGAFCQTFAKIRLGGGK